MKIATSTPFLLRPYAVSRLVEDAAPQGAPSAAPNVAVRAAAPGLLPTLGLGRALLKSAAAGTSLVVAANSPTDAKPAEPIDYKKLAKGVAAIAGETLTGKAVAKSAWQLSSMSSTTTADELAKTLVSHHVSPAKAKSLAEEALKLLHDPISRGILISISAGAATYIVVQRTSLSTGRKWAIIVAAGLLAGAAFALLRQLGAAA